MNDQVQTKRRQPKDDMISFLTQVTYSALGRKLTDLEINGIVYAMIIGGLETTQYALEEQAQLLCERPGVFAAVKNDREKVRHFIEEGMRLRSPTQGLSTRITSQDEVFQGVTVPAGSLLHLRWAAANIDADEFECPHELQLDRKAVSRHLTFSAGPRVCPGAGISRLEQTIAWTRLFDRLERHRVRAGEHVHASARHHARHAGTEAAVREGALSRFCDLVRAQSRASADDTQRNALCSSRRKPGFAKACGPSPTSETTTGLVSPPRSPTRSDCCRADDSTPPAPAAARAAAE